MKRGWYIKGIGILFPLLSISFLFSSVNAQNVNLGDLGAGVVKFLLTNPKTANQLDATQQAALGVIGDLFKTSGERKYQMQYATASSDQVTINTANNQQAQFVRTQDGNIFLLVNGVIYPVAKELVNQAIGVRNESYTSDKKHLDANDLAELENKFNHSSVIFTYKWKKDFNGDGYPEFNEYQGINNVFYDNENFIIAFSDIFPKTKDYIFAIEIINDYTGNSCFYGEGKYNFEHTICYKEVTAGMLNQGIYQLYGQVIDPKTKKVISYCSNKVQILNANSEIIRAVTDKMNYEKPLGRDIPVGIFFYSTLIPTKDTMCYNNFSNLNAQSYSLQKGVIIGLNVPQKTGELIIQINRADGTIVDAKALNSQNIMALMLCRNCKEQVEANSGTISDIYKIDSKLQVIEIANQGEYTVKIIFLDGKSFEQKLILSE